MTTNEPAKPDVPFELIVTSLPNVFTIPAPPADFDPNTASPEELIKHGILWPRPGEEAPLALRDAWERVFSRWREMKHIVPEFGPPLIKRRVLRKLTQVAPGLWENNMWAGAVEFGKWDSVFGFLSVPTVTPSGEPQGTEHGGGWNSYSWIGLDGTNGSSNEVLQAGVMQNVDANGNATYVPWYEWYVPPDQPDGTWSHTYDDYPYVLPRPITNVSVVPGQNPCCLVRYRFESLQWLGYIDFYNNNLEPPEHVALILIPPPGARCSGYTAEWIVEAPGGGIPETSLPNFRDTPVVFSSSWCFGPQHTIGNPGDPPPVGNTYYIQGFGTTLTKVTRDWKTCTIEYVGP